MAFAAACATTERAGSDATAPVVAPERVPQDAALVSRSRNLEVEPDGVRAAIEFAAADRSQHLGNSGPKLLFV